jgi:hypothetical protein
VTRIGGLGTTLAGKVVRSLPIFVTLVMEATNYSETSIFTRVTWRNIPDDNILHSHRSENLKPYKVQKYTVK